jgi:hypothetical protein
MKPVAIVDIGSNDYLSSMYLGPLARYMGDNGIPVTVGSNEDGIHDSIVIIHGDLLSPERILAIKNNNNLLVSFDINDSSYFSSAYQGSPETAMVDLFFKVSGIPKTNYTEELNIDRNFRIFGTQHQYLPEADWPAFEALKPKIRPLPYVLWTPLVGSGPTRPYNQRSGKVLIRGGNHFWRVVLFLRLVQQGLDDERCRFATDAYFTDSMIERFRFCQPCIQEKRQYGKTRYNEDHDIQHCKSPVMWGTPGEFFGGPAFGRHEFGHWNNRCPASFMWLSKEYERCRGPLNSNVERALNGSMAPFNEFVNDIQSAAYYADYKWVNTINTPPRFWEAASCGTVNFYPERTDDQEYFPAIQKNIHYLTFPNDMTNLNLDGVSQHTWTEISNNAKDVYETWIRGDRYVVSTNLLRHIVEQIEAI